MIAQQASVHSAMHAPRTSSLLMRCSRMQTLVYRSDGGPARAVCCSNVSDALLSTRLCAAGQDGHVAGDVAEGATAVPVAPARPAEGQRQGPIRAGMATSHLLRVNEALCSRACGPKHEWRPLSHANSRGTMGHVACHGSSRQVPLTASDPAHSMHTVSSVGGLCRTRLVMTCRRWTRSACWC